MAPRGRKAVNPYEALQRAPAAEQEQSLANLRTRVALLAELSPAARPNEPSESQNEHLECYRSFIRFWKELSDDLTDDEVDVVAFSADLDNLFEQLSGFMISLRDLTPDEIGQDHPMTYSELCEYRDSMLFWVDRIFEQLHPGTAKPVRRDLQSQMERAMVSKAVPSNANSMIDHD